MPIYEFECLDCGNQVEVIQKISDKPLKDCSSCGKPSMKKMVSAAAFRLSGSGWYETDFKAGKKKNLASNDSEKSSDSNNKSKDSKPKKAEKDSNSK